MFLRFLFSLKKVIITPTVCYSDLDLRGKMIIFESILSTFITIVIFRDRRGNSKKYASA